MWTKESHFRFSKKDRDLVNLLIFIRNETNFTLKDILFAHIIPLTLGELDIPPLYISNLPFEIDEEQLKLEMPIKIDQIIIARRRNNKSKGFGFFTCFKYDNYDKLKHYSNIEIRGRSLVIQYVIYDYKSKKINGKLVYLY